MGRLKRCPQKSIRLYYEPSNQHHHQHQHHFLMPDTETHAHDNIEGDGALQGGPGNLIGDGDGPLPTVVPTVLFYRTKISLPKLYHMHSKKEKGAMVHGIAAAGANVVPGKELHPLASNPMAPKLNEVQEMITEAIYVNGEPCHFEKIYEYVSARWKNMNFKRKDGTPYSTDCRRAILANLRENAYQVSLFKKDKQLSHCWWFRRTIEEIKQRKGDEITGKTEKVKEEKKPSDKEKVTRQAAEKPQGKEEKPPKQADRAAHKINSEKYASPKAADPYKAQNSEKNSTQKPPGPPTTKIPKNPEKLQLKMENSEKSPVVAAKPQGYVANAKGAISSSGVMASEKTQHIVKGVPGEKGNIKGLSRQASQLGAPPSPGQSNGNGGGPTQPRTRVRTISKSTLKLVDLSHIQTVVSHLLSEEKSSTVTDLIAKTIQFINNIRSGFKFSSRNLRTQIITVLSKTNHKGQIFKRDPSNYLLWRLSEENPWSNATQEERDAKLGALVGHIMAVKETREVFV